MCSAQATWWLALLMPLFIPSWKRDVPTSMLMSAPGLKVWTTCDRSVKLILNRWRRAGSRHLIQAAKW